MNHAAIPAGEPVVLDAFVEPAVCRMLLDEVAHCWWTPSGTLVRSPCGRMLARESVCRTSVSSTEYWLGESCRRQLRRVERRLAARFGLATNRLDPWQIVRYRKGARFDDHHDAGLFADSSAGEREASVILYLDDQPGSSGATVFPILKRRIASRPGRLVIWRNLLDDGSVDPVMIHSGAPAGRTKTLLITWLRERSARAPTGGENA